MRIRKDLAHGWIGWRHDVRRRPCPQCGNSYSVDMMFPVTLNNPDGTWTQPYRCARCAFIFRLHFRFTGDGWRVAQILLKRRSP